MVFHVLEHVLILVHFHQSLCVSISYSDECCEAMNFVYIVPRLLFDDGVRLGAFVISVTKGNNEGVLGWE